MAHQQEPGLEDLAYKYCLQDLPQQHNKLELPDLRQVVVTLQVVAVAVVAVLVDPADLAAPVAAEILIQNLGRVLVPVLVIEEQPLPVVVQEVVHSLAQHLAPIH